MNTELLARLINSQTDKLAHDTACQIRNVWITSEGKIAVIQDPAYLKARISDDRKVLNDLLRQLDNN